MSAAELRASFGLAGIFGLRMLGMFIILPVFSLYAETLPGGQDHADAIARIKGRQALLQLGALDAVDYGAHCSDEKKPPDPGSGNRAVAEW